MRVLLADDQPIFLEGLQNLLESRRVEVVGTAGSGAEAVDQVRRLRPDAVLMDVRMPGLSGLDATRIIKAEMPEVQVVILSFAADDGDLFEAIKSGASGYLLKDLQANELFRMLEDLEAGRPPLSPGLGPRIFREFARQANESEAPPRAPGGELLNLRHLQVLSLAAQGLTNKEIGTALFITESTVKYHVNHILKTLRAGSRQEAVVRARQLGLMRPAHAQRPELPASPPQS